jgi:hypothetical protein
VAELDRLRRHVLVGGPVRDYEAPLLGELLEGVMNFGSETVAFFGMATRKPYPSDASDEE